MIPMTPIGTETRWIRSPLGRSHSPSRRPSGSSRAATCSTPAAIAPTRPGSRARRSSRAPLSPDSRAAAISAALASRIAASSSRMAAAATRSARRLVSADEAASACAAALASAPSAAILAAMSRSVSRLRAASAMLTVVAPRRARDRRGGSSRRGHGSRGYALFHGICGRRSGARRRRNRRPGRGRPRLPARP